MRILNEEYIPQVKREKPFLLFLLACLIISLACLDANNMLNISASLKEGYHAYFGSTYNKYFQLLTIFLIYVYRDYLCPSHRGMRLRYQKWYLWWTCLLVLCGLVIISNRVEYYQWIDGSISLLEPILIWLFFRPDVSEKVMSFFYRYSWIPFLALFVWQLGFTEFFLQPFVFLICIFPLFPKRVALCVILFAMLYATNDVQNERAPLIKGVVAFLTGIVVLFRNKIPLKIFKIGRKFCFASVLVLLVYIFSDLFMFVTGRLSSNDALFNQETSETSFKSDTRSLIYIDVINSSVKHGYYIWGRTPTRGFDIDISGALFFSGSLLSSNDFNKGERHKNEMVHTNVFDWEGLIGLYLFSMIYVMASYWGVFYSRNRIIPILACYIGWRWAWGFVEDVNNFMVLNVDLWLTMAICYSPYFRNMTDDEFKIWARGLLSTKYRKIFNRNFAEKYYLTE